MKKLAILAALAFVVPAYAQQQDYTLKVTGEELNLISDALGTQPFNKVVVLINKLRAQVINQQQPSKPVDNPEPDKK